MVIHWKDDYIFEAPPHSIQCGVPGNGVHMDATSPFKGVCHQCGKRTIVRHYPYNMLEWFGTYCSACFEDISNGTSSGGGICGGWFNMMPWAECVYLGNLF